SVSHLVPSGSPFIGGKGVNHIQDGTATNKKPAPSGAGFLFVAILLPLREGEVGRGLLWFTLKWFVAKGAQL
ncbi:hypothetical protein, partial [Aeromonas rivipollensis]|uniref:hypothetical protein n=1 Tax=Aeromonas rivipollensis TaxID=948519 RepID=UPI003D1A4345